MFRNIRTVAFYDLCIQEALFTEEDIEKSLKNIYDLGYRTIAINQTVEDGIIESKKKKKKGDARETHEVVPAPYDLSSVLAIVKKLEFQDFQVFNRLTIVFSNQESLHKITKSPNIKKYHLLAASPTTTQALTFTCGNLEADILTYNPENKFNHHLTRKMYNQLVQRGYYIELQYSHAIEDSTKRKNLIHASHLYHCFGKSRNVFFSSGARSSLFIRNPYDIISLGFLFGLNELQSKGAVHYSPNKVIFNSVGRGCGKAVMFVENISMEEESKTDESEDDMDTEDEPVVKKTKITQDSVINI